MNDFQKTNETLQITKNDLNWASKQKILPPNQIDTLWNHLNLHASLKNQYTSRNLLQCLIAFVFIKLIYDHILHNVNPEPSLFLTLGSILGMIFFTFTANEFWKNLEYRFLGGVLYVCAALCTLVISVSFLQWLQFFCPSLIFISSNGYLMSNGDLISNTLTIVVALVYLYKRPFVPLWILILSLGLIVMFERSSEFYGDQPGNFDNLFPLIGTIYFIIGYILERRKPRLDFAYWGYFFGTILIIFSNTLYYSGLPGLSFLYPLILLMSLSLPLFFAYRNQPTLAFLAALLLVILSNKMLIVLMISAIAAGLYWYRKAKKTPNQNISISKDLYNDSNF